MYFEIGNHVCVETLIHENFRGEITKIVVKKIDGKLETMLFLSEIQSKKKSYGQVCLFASQIQDIQKASD